jgi:hypothetical protein
MHAPILNNKMMLAKRIIHMFSQYGIAVFANIFDNERPSYRSWKYMLLVEVGNILLFTAENAGPGHRIEIYHSLTPSS